MNFQLARKTFKEPQSKKKNFEVFEYDDSKVELIILSLKGVFAKMKGGYRLTAKNQALLDLY